MEFNKQCYFSYFIGGFVFLNVVFWRACQMSQSLFLLLSDTQPKNNKPNKASETEKKRFVLKRNKKGFEQK